MFTLEQINDIHDRLGKRATLPQYLQALRAIGVEKYDSFITDGHSEYFGAGSQTVVSPPAHRPLSIAPKTNREALQEYLTLHSEGKIDYLEMSIGLAESGTEKWTFNTKEMTITYYGTDGHTMLVEAIN